MEQKEERECWIYAWSAPLDLLEPKIWKYVPNPFHLFFLMIFIPLCEICGNRLLI
jgi:hypothetical protein